MNTNSKFKDRQIEAIDLKVKELLSITLFHFSFTSKELFHSNFISWLAYINQVECAQLFGFTGAGPIQLKRELNRKIGKLNVWADIAFVTAIDKKITPKLIIENKVKSIAEDGQLTNIRAAFKDANRFVLWSLFEPDKDSHNGWDLLTYKEFAEKLEASKFNFAATNTYHLNIIDEYVKILNTLNDIIKLLPISGDYDFSKRSNPQLYSLLTQIKLWEIYQRIASRKFLAQVTAELSQRSVKQPLTKLSINHSVATIDFYYSIDGYNIGIQIEDNQYRKFLRGPNAQVVAPQMHEAGVWFDFLNPPRRGRIKNFGVFNMDKHGGGYFYYQYDTKGHFTINPEKGVQEMADTIKNDLDWILQNETLIKSYVSDKKSKLNLQTNG